MDYTTTARVKAELRIKETTDDTLIADQVTRASRIIDRLCTGAPDSDDYLTLDDVVDEMLTGLVNANGHILCYPHRVVVNSVASFSYRINPADGWHSVDPAYLSINKARPGVSAWTTMSSVYETVDVKLSYNGGLAAAVADLPLDVIDLATLLAARLYREGETGLTDQIGMPEFGAGVYTKAFPVRFLETLKSYRRVVPW